MDIPISINIIVFLEAVFAFYLLLKEIDTRFIKSLIICAFMISLAFFIRYRCLGYVSQDYIIFLSQWIFDMKQYGIEALGMSVGNYNIPYMFILYLISNFENIDSLLLIKVISIFFDILLAWSAMKIVSLITDSEKRKIVCYIAVLLLPTVIIDSSLWGQCDSIYVSLAVLSIFFALNDRPWLSIISIAVSFSFKLQAIFVMPVFAYFLFTRRINWYHFIAFPIVYFIMMIPGLIAGMSISDAMLMYTTQTGTIGGGYSYNAPSFLAIIEAGKTSLAGLNTETAIAAVSKIFIIIAFFYTLAVLTVSIINRVKFSSNNLFVVLLCALFALGIPYLLPHMHERYFYMADAFLLILSICSMKYLPVFIMTQFSSIGCYYIYYNSVQTSEYGPVYIFSFIMGFALLILVWKYISAIRTRNAS